jgi:hypothetical protein
MRLRCRWTSSGWFLFSLSFGLVKALTAPPGIVQRDWNQHPAIVERHTRTDVFAVGDVHGDYERLAELLAANHLIAEKPSAPDQAQWKGGQAILICTGDLIDRWTNGIAVIRFFRHLQFEANQAGGEVIVTMGNHEAEFLATTGDHHRTQGFDRELRAAGVDPALVRAGRDSDGIGQFLRSLPLVAIINDWCFVHAGNFHDLSLPELSRTLRESVEREGFGTSLLSDPDSMLEARLQPKPWWELESNDPDHGEAKLRTMIQRLGCEHLVTGHQPKAVRFADGTMRPAGRIQSEFNGLLFLIDAGLSRGIDLSHGALLWIQTGKRMAASLSPTGKVTELWRSRD